MRCENVRKPACGAVATNAVPMFTGSVWMCPSCSLGTLGSDDTGSGPIRVRDYVRIVDLETWGVVKRATLAGEFVVEYFRDGAARLAYRSGNGLRSA